VVDKLTNRPTDLAAPMLISGVISGIFGSILVLLVFVIDAPQIYFHTLSFGQLVMFLGVGLGVGLVILWPTFMAFSAIGIRLANSYKWARTRYGWAISGSIIAGIILVGIAAIQSEPLPLLFYGVFGALNGAIAGLLCCRTIGVPKLFSC
jgi:hypothetical protein